MSDQHSYGGEESQGGESRSVDSESAGRSHRDFFSEHPDDAAAREWELVNDMSLVQTDIFAPGQSSVPIFNISGGQEDYQDQPEKSIPGGIDSGRTSAMKQGFVVPRSQGERIGGETDAMRVGELNLTAERQCLHHHWFDEYFVC
jgi:hypothetical protein